MKTINNFLIAGFIISAFSCSNGIDDVVSEADLAALQTMETSYAGALDANNSLATYVETTGNTNDDTCFNYDSIFHQNDSIFEVGHMMYSHNNNGDDHDSGSWDMGSGMNGFGNGGMMGGDHSGEGFNSQNCSQNNLELMDSLMLAHEQYHPEG